MEHLDKGELLLCLWHDVYNAVRDNAIGDSRLEDRHIGNTRLNEFDVDLIYFQLDLIRALKHILPIRSVPCRAKRINNAWRYLVHVDADDPPSRTHLVGRDEHVESSSAAQVDDSLAMKN
jgi:hypothetical protein